jgi:hypothetical protein
MSCDACDLVPGLQGALETTDPVQLLVWAEAGGYGVPASVAARAAAVNVALNLGYPVNSSDREIFVSIILTRLRNLSYLTQGPSLAQPKGQWYGWKYA